MFNLLRRKPRAAPAEPVPEITPEVEPVVLVRQPPRFAQADHALADEAENSIDTIEADLENVFAAIRARDRMLELRQKPEENFSLSLAMVEKFSFEMIEYGPESQYHTPIPQLADAFQAWIREGHRPRVERGSFVRAMTIILEWHGGHRANHCGESMFVGCRIRSAKRRIGRPATEFAGGLLR